MFPSVFPHHVTGRQILEQIQIHGILEVGMGYMALFTEFIHRIHISYDSGLLQLKKTRAANVEYVFAWSVEPNTCQFLKLKF